MNAEIAGKLVAPFIEKQWPNDKADIYQILRLGINKAWQEGRWLGMTKEMFVNVHEDVDGSHYFMGPQPYPILLAINIEGQHEKIRGKEFMFHKNGYGDIKNYPGCRWNQDVYDLGEYPILNKDNIIFSEGVKIGVRAIGQAGPNEKINIAGTYADGNKVYTYKKNDLGNVNGCSVNLGDISPVSGVELAISNTFNYVNNINFTSIQSITKTVTNTPVEVIAIDTLGNGHLIARMEPYQRFSKYRKYQVPRPMCDRYCLHALFKISQQDVIASDTDNIIITNEEALISLAKGIYSMYYKEQSNEGTAFIMQGISVLEKEKREEESPNEFPIQVEGIWDGDLGALKFYH